MKALPLTLLIAGGLTISGCDKPGAETIDQLAYKVASRVKQGELDKLNEIATAPQFNNPDKTTILKVAKGARLIRYEILSFEDALKQLPSLKKSPDPQDPVMHLYWERSGADGPIQIEQFFVITKVNGRFFLKAD